MVVLLLGRRNRSARKRYCSFGKPVDELIQLREVIRLDLKNLALIKNEYPTTELHFADKRSPDRPSVNHSVAGVNRLDVMSTEKRDPSFLELAALLQ